jgi:hypothetical protein
MVFSSRIILASDQGILANHAEALSSLSFQRGLRRKIFAVHRASASLV